jgi:hypothetical protein
MCDNAVRANMLELVIDDMVRSEPRGPIWNDERDLLFAGEVAQIAGELDQLDLLWACGHIGASVARVYQGSEEGRAHTGVEAASVSARQIADSGVHLVGATMLVPAPVIEAINDWHRKLARALYWASAELRRACAFALMAGADLTMADPELGQVA